MRATAAALAAALVLTAAGVAAAQRSALEEEDERAAERRSDRRTVELRVRAEAARRGAEDQRPDFERGSEAIEARRREIEARRRDLAERLERARGRQEEARRPALAERLEQARARRDKPQRDEPRRDRPRHEGEVRPVVLRFVHISAESFLETLEQLGEQDAVGDALDAIPMALNEEANAVVAIAPPPVVEHLERIADGLDQPNEYEVHRRERKIDEHRLMLRAKEAERRADLGIEAGKLRLEAARRRTEQGPPPPPCPRCPMGPRRGPRMGDGTLRCPHCGRGEGPGPRRPGYACPGLERPQGPVPPRGDRPRSLRDLVRPRGDRDAPPPAGRAWGRPDEPQGPPPKMRDKRRDGPSRDRPPPGRPGLRDTPRRQDRPGRGRRGANADRPGDEPRAVEPARDDRPPRFFLIQDVEPTSAPPVSTSSISIGIVADADGVRVISSEGVDPVVVSSADGTTVSVSASSSDGTAGLAAADGEPSGLRRRWRGRMGAGQLTEDGVGALGLLEDGGVRDRLDLTPEQDLLITDLLADREARRQEVRGSFSQGPGREAGRPLTPEERRDMWRGRVEGYQALREELNELDRVAWEALAEPQRATLREVQRARSRGQLREGIRGFLGPEALADLDLTDEQIERIDEIRRDQMRAVGEEVRARMAEVRDLPPEERGDRIRELFQGMAPRREEIEATFRGRMMEVLTPEQRVKAEKYIEEARARLGNVITKTIRRPEGEKAPAGPAPTGPTPQPPPPPEGGAARPVMLPTVT